MEKLKETLKELNGKEVNIKITIDTSNFEDGIDRMTGKLLDLKDVMTQVGFE